MEVNNTNNSDESIVYQLDELLDSLGLLSVDIYLYQIVIPITSLIGLLLCVLTAIILFDKKFIAPIYDYFRVITVTYIIQLTFALAYGTCFTPKYFLNMDSYSCAIVQCAYIPYSGFTSNYDSLLEIAILFERIKIINPFVKKHFTIKPRKMILATLFPCLLLNAVYGLVYVPFYGGDFYYYDAQGKYEVNSFWFISASSLADSNIGSIALIVFYFFRDILIMLVTIILNIIATIEMRNFFRDRNRILQNSITIQVANNLTYTAAGQNDSRKKSEKNAIKLVLTKCLISTITKAVVLLSDIYYLFSSDYIATLIGGITDYVLVLGPAISFFVYYHFNRDFRKKLSEIFSRCHKKFREIYIE
jgi:hypothetical protein